MTRPAVTLLDHAGQRIALDVANPYLYELAVTSHDIDAQGHVNNAAIVRWMDKAAFAHSAAVGYDMAAFRAMGAAFVVRRHEIDYLAQGYEGDAIAVATWPCKMERFTALRRHQIIRVSDGSTLARALTTWIFIDTTTHRPRRMPAEMIAHFEPEDDAG